MNQTLSHDNSQLYGAALDTLCIHMAKINTGVRERDSQKQQRPEIEINKALRLVKQVLLLAAGRTLCVRACVSNVCWTHFRSERKCWQRAFTFLFEIYTSHHSRGKAHVPSVSMCSEPKRSFLCVCLPLSSCVFVCVRERGSVCMSAY